MPVYTVPLRAPIPGSDRDAAVDSTPQLLGLCGVSAGAEHSVHARVALPFPCCLWVQPRIGLPDVPLPPSKEPQQVTVQLFAVPNTTQFSQDTAGPSGLPRTCLLWAPLGSGGAAPGGTSCRREGKTLEECADTAAISHMVSTAQTG